MILFGYHWIYNQPKQTNHNSAVHNLFTRPGEHFQKLAFDPC